MFTWKEFFEKILFHDFSFRLKRQKKLKREEGRYAFKYEKIENDLNKNRQNSRGKMGVERAKH